MDGSEDEFIIARIDDLVVNLARMYSCGALPKNQAAVFVEEDSRYIVAQCDLSHVIRALGCVALKGDML